MRYSLVRSVFLCCWLISSGSSSGLWEGDYRYERACTKDVTRSTCPQLPSGVFNGFCQYAWVQFSSNSVSNTGKKTWEVYYKEVACQKVIKHDLIWFDVHEFDCSVKIIKNVWNYITLQDIDLKIQLTCFQGETILIKAAYSVNMANYSDEARICGSCTAESCDYNGCCPNQIQFSTQHYSRQLRKHGQLPRQYGRVSTLDHRMVARWHSKCRMHHQCDILARYSDILIDKHPIVAPDFVDVIYTCSKTAARNYKSDSEDNVPPDKKYWELVWAIISSVEKNSSGPLNISDVLQHNISDKANIETENEKRNSSSFVWIIAVVVLTLVCTALIMAASLKKLTGQIQKDIDSHSELPQGKQHEVFMTVEGQKMTGGDKTIDLYQDEVNLYEDIENYYNLHQKPTASPEVENVHCNQLRESASHANDNIYIPVF